MNKYIYTAELTAQTIGQLCEEIGDMPNIDFPTLGGEIMWDTILKIDGWKVQVNKITDHARILDPNNIRKAWGSKTVMKEKLKRMRKKNFLEYGDVIGIHRIGGLYDHYAVYIGNDEVIHYAGEGNDFGGKIGIHKAPMSEFLKNDAKMFVLNFSKTYKRPSMINVPATGFAGISMDQKVSFKKEKYHLYSPEETVQRAKERIGETKYNLVTNNCEHFAIWCKTGISESYQVEAVIKNIAKCIPIIVSGI